MAMENPLFNIFSMAMLNNQMVYQRVFNRFSSFSCGLPSQTPSDFKGSHRFKQRQSFVPQALGPYEPIQWDL